MIYGRAAVTSLLASGLVLGAGPLGAQSLGSFNWQLQPFCNNLTVKRVDFVRSFRLTGTVEADQATAISTPRLAGQNMPLLVVTGTPYITSFGMP